MSSEVKSGCHCRYDLKVHLVFVIKYRRKVLTLEMLDFLKPIFQEICREFNSELLEFNGEEDHVHLLISYPPTVAISTFVNSLKGVSSRFLRQKFPGIKKYLWKGRLWSRSYYSGSCGGATIETIKAYIENQKSPNA